MWEGHTFICVGVSGKSFWLMELTVSSFNIFKYAYDYSSLVCAINIYLLLWSKYTGVFCLSSVCPDRPEPEVVAMQQIVFCHRRRAQGSGCQRHRILPANLPARRCSGKRTGSDFHRWKKWAGMEMCPCCAPQINAFQASMVLFIGKVWGAVTDPVVGFFITKSKWTRIGRLMPWWDPLLSLHKLIQESWNDNLLPVWWNFKNWLCILINASWYHWQRHSLGILPIKHTNTKWIHKCVFPNWNKSIHCIKRKL